MLAVSRCGGDLYSIPKFSLDYGDVEGFRDELHGFHDQFADCFMRSESRENFILYMTGQFSLLKGNPLNRSLFKSRTGMFVRCSVL